MNTKKFDRGEFWRKIRERYMMPEDIRKLLAENKEAIVDYNANFLPKIPMMGATAMLIALIVSFVHEAMAASRVIYVAMYFLCLIFFAITRGGRIKKHALLCLYGASIILFGATLYLSVVKGTDYPGAAVLIVLSVYPILIIDKPRNFLLMEFAFYVIHSYLSIVRKGPEIGEIDMVNGFIATIIGCFLGWFMLISRLRALDLERQLIIQKETDVLTGLHSRRKLFETIAAIEQGEIDRPSGVMMMDIDYFKKYNDTHGHAAGDMCLKAFGNKLSSFVKKDKIEFYRYGGEEFVAFLWNTDADKVGTIAEEIRAAIANMDIEYGKITTSIGYVYCDEPAIINYETWIERADEAAYVAKDRGRNCVARAESNIVQE